MSDPEGFVLRREATAGDPRRVREIVAATGFFSAEEIRIAGELVEERLAKGEDESGYVFLFAENAGRVLAYSCFGRIPLTLASWDLYWIAVDPAAQARGFGRWLLAASEAAVRAAGGERVYAETSTRAQYQPTRAFYERCDYDLAARLENFYAPGDGKAIYCKTLGAGTSGSAARAEAKSRR